jgi:hypothetical protein
LPVVEDDVLLGDCETGKVKRDCGTQYSKHTNMQQSNVSTKQLSQRGTQTSKKRELTVTWAES